MRRALVGLLVVLGCGEEHGSSPDAAPDAPSGPPIDAPEVLPPDAPLDNPGFVNPTATLRANVEQSPDVWQEVGLADMSCLSTASTDAATTVAVSLSTTVRDFQSNNTIANASVAAFPEQTIAAPFAGSPFLANGSGNVTISIPTGTKRFGLRITDPAALDTFVFDLIAAPNQASQTLARIRRFSTTTGQTLPALIGVSRTPGTGLVLGQMLDCQGRAVSNAIATVSSQPQVPQHLTGADTFYFSSSVGLPVRHSQRTATSEDGQFMVIELPPASAFIQVWGFLSDGDLALGKLVLVAELPAPILADSVASGSQRPLRL